jgi:hypothetical protein
MDEVSAQATLTEAEVDPRLAVSVPRTEVERALESNEEVDLLLDVVRTNGDREERRVVLGWGRDALERLAEQEGERVIIAIDPDSLEKAFNDVEAHGMREVGATLAIAVVALGAAGGAAAARGGEAQFQPFATDFPTVEATVDASSWEGVTGSGYGIRGTPSDAAQSAKGTLADLTGGPSAADSAAGIESVRAAQEAPEAAPDAYAGIEDIRAGGTAVPPDPSAGIENVRATRTAPVHGSAPGGDTISAPSPAVSAALAGGVVLTLAGAAFALRRRREPEPAT